jgi:hypothetical protein
MNMQPRGDAIKKFGTLSAKLFFSLSKELLDVLLALGFQGRLSNILFGDLQY